MGSGEPSLSSGFITVEQPPNPPGPPLEVKALKTTADSVTVGFVPPSSKSGKKVVRYILEYRKSAEDQWFQTQGNGENDSIRVSNLKQGEEYCIR